MSTHLYWCTTDRFEELYEHLQELESRGIGHRIPENPMESYSEGEGGCEIFVCKTREQQEWIERQAWLDIVDYTVEK